MFYHLLILSMSTCPGGKSYANSGLKVFFVQLNIMYGPSYSILKSTFFKSKVYLKKKRFYLRESAQQDRKRERA